MSDANFWKTQLRATNKGLERCAYQVDALIEENIKLQKERKELTEDRASLIRENAELNSQLQAARRVCEAAEKLYFLPTIPDKLKKALEAYKQVRGGE